MLIRRAERRIIEYIKEKRTVKLLHLLRYNSAFIVVASSAILVSATNLTAGKNSSGFLFGYFGNTEAPASPLEGRILGDSMQKDNLAVASLEVAKTGINVTEDYEECVENETGADSLGKHELAANTGTVLKDPEMDGGVRIYEVKEGDTIESIAIAYKVSINTVKWANEIENIDSIHPGDKIFILPIAGLEYTIQKGDTIKNIAKKYKADEEKIIAFNELPANGEIEVGEKIMIPGGIKEEPAPAIDLTPQRRTYTAFGDTGIKLDGKAGTGHRFPYGYCTWYVASRRYVPWGGNAGTWLYNAKVSGYSTGKTPRVGSIIVTNESWWGHVGIVEKVSGSQITISEMNYERFAKVNRRTLSVGSRQIKGYIY